MHACSRGRIGSAASASAKSDPPKHSVLIFSSILIALSAIDVILLQSLKAISESSPSLLDNKIFSSGVAIALYIFPATFAGIAVNLVSHLLNKHLDEAEQKYDKQQSSRSFQINLKVMRGEKKSDIRAEKLIREAQSRVAENTR